MISESYDMTGWPPKPAAPRGIRADRQAGTHRNCLAILVLNARLVFTAASTVDPKKPRNYKCGRNAESHRRNLAFTISGPATPYRSGGIEPSRPHQLVYVAAGLECSPLLCYRSVNAYWYPFECGISEQ